MKGNKSLKKFCKLSKYIEQKDKDLYEVFENLCMSHLLKPARGEDGITLLYPKEKKYREKIINAAYTKNPEEAIKMLKSIIVKGVHNNYASFSKGVTNLLDQRIIVDETTDTHVKLSTGLKLEKDTEFEPLTYNNMVVYFIVGKGEIPLNGPNAPTEVFDEKKIKGGSSNSKMNLHKLLQDKYVTEICKPNNIYTKKVFLQLKLLSAKKNVTMEDLQDYLGNDEFSDSYLLDNYCEKSCPDAFATLIAALNSANETELSNITAENYLNIKTSIVGNSSSQVVHDPSRLNGLVSTMDIRLRVFDLYKNDKKKIGKDLFIVYCNVARDMWNTELDKKSAFETFAYIASKVYNKNSDIVNQEFDIAKDLTLYGNLLKSDVYKFVPSGRYNQNTVSLPIPSSMPSPTEMKLYSLCGFINMPVATSVSGGNPDVDFLLQDLKTM